MTPEEQARNIVAWIYHGGVKTVSRERMIGVIADAVRQVQADERERCARIADAAAGPFGGVGLLRDIADVAEKIRKGP